MKLNAVINALRSMPLAAVDSKKNPRGERGLFSENCPFDEFFMGSNKTTFVLQKKEQMKLCKLKMSLILSRVPHSYLPHNLGNYNLRKLDL